MILILQSMLKVSTKTNNSTSSNLPLLHGKYMSLSACEGKTHSDTHAST